MNLRMHDDMCKAAFSILTKRVNAMHNEFTAIIERDDDWFIAYCPEMPGANGQGKTPVFA